VTIGERPLDGEARRAYWEDVHAGKDVDGVSWWQAVPELSLDLVTQSGIPVDAPVIDVGAGWSTLTDFLVERGHTDVTAIDLSTTALDTVRARLGDRAAGVRFVVADVLDLHMGRQYALWHDRAVMHFLTEPDERDDYRASLERSVMPGGWFVVATFGPDGPTSCSGLPIVRYSHEELAAEFPGWRVVAQSGEEHRTPWGKPQQFTALLLQRDGD